MGLHSCVTYLKSQTPLSCRRKAAWTLPHAQGHRQATTPLHTLCPGSSTVPLHLTSPQVSSSQGLSCKGAAPACPKLPHTGSSKLRVLCNMTASTSQATGRHSYTTCSTLQLSITNTAIPCKNLQSPFLWVFMHVPPVHTNNYPVTIYASHLWGPILTTVKVECLSTTTR